MIFGSTVFHAKVVNSAAPCSLWLSPERQRRRCPVSGPWRVEVWSVPRGWFSFVMGVPPCIIQSWMTMMQYWNNHGDLEIPYFNLFDIWQEMLEPRNYEVRKLVFGKWTWESNRIHVGVYTAAEQPVYDRSEMGEAKLTSRLARENAPWSVSHVCILN